MAPKALMLMVYNVKNATSPQTSRTFAVVIAITAAPTIAATTNIIAPSIPPKANALLNRDSV